MNDASSTAPNLESIIQKYIQLRDKIDAITEECNARCKPYDEGMKTIGAWLMDYLTKTGQTSVKTESGTAYTATHFATKVIDREKFLKFLELGNWELATITASRADVEQYLDQHHGETPPGVETSRRVNIVVRRP